MKSFIISVCLIALCIASIVAQPKETFTLEQPFQVNTFIPYYTTGTMVRKILYIYTFDIFFLRSLWQHFRLKMLLLVIHH
jgi:hypothetical protein